MTLTKHIILPIIAIGGLALSVNAGVTVSSTTPTVDGADIANLTWTDTATDKIFNDATNPGQAFTTGGDAGYTLNSISIQVNSTSNQDPDPAPGNRTWKIRVVAIDANNTDTTTVVLEDESIHTQAAGQRWSAGDWFTWTLDTPVNLNPNTLYGIDVEHVGGGDWGNGIPYLRYNRSDDVAGAYRYTKADGDPATINSATGHERVFHLDIAAAGTDEDPPVLVGYVPSIGAGDVPVGTNIEATFNESIQLGASGNITLDNLSGGADVVIDVASHGGQLSVSGSVLTIDPTSDLDSGANYAVLVDAGSVTDTATTPNDFVGITDPAVWPFTTSMPDTTEPGDDSLSPGDGDSDVAVNTNLVITFDENVQKGSGDIVITQTGGSVFETIPVGDARVSVVDAVATIDPSGTLAYDTDYHVEIADGAFKDLSNNDFPGFSGTTDWNFRTMTEVVAVPGNVVVSSNAPTVDGADIANLIWTDTATDKIFNDATNPGQAFTTGGDAGYTLNSISMQVNSTSNQDPDPAPGDRTWTVRVVAIDPNNSDTTTIAIETDHLQASGTRWSSGDWFTWTLVTPVNLSPNTHYGIDVEHVGGGDWGNGIPYLRYNRSDDVAGAYRYTKADSDPTTINSQTGHDRVFHLDIAVAGPPVSDYASWIAGFDVGGQDGFDQDPDGDGLDNGLENFLGTDPSVFSTGLVQGSEPGSFSHSQNANPADDVSAAAYMWSKDLVTWYGSGEPDGAGTIVTFTPTLDNPEGTTTVTSAVTGTPADKVFMRLSVGLVVPPPPLLSESFDDDNGGFTIAVPNAGTGTEWAYGVPNSSDQGGGGVTDDNGGGGSCWGTNLTGGYVAGTIAVLRSPVIDLSLVTSAELSFALSLDALAGHTYQVDVIDATDMVVANVIPATSDATATTSPWVEMNSIAIPASVMGQSIRLEWRFIGEGAGDYNGAYLDDVVVTGTPL